MKQLEEEITYGNESTGTEYCGSASCCKGGRVESQNDEQAIIVYEGPNIPMYLFLTVVSFGLYWTCGWLFYRPRSRSENLSLLTAMGIHLYSK